jgi:hypothetical protein
VEDEPALDVVRGADVGLTIGMGCPVPWPTNVRFLVVTRASCSVSIHSVGSPSWVATQTTFADAGRSISMTGAAIRYLWTTRQSAEIWVPSLATHQSAEERSVGVGTSALLGFLLLAALLLAPSVAPFVTHDATFFGRM